MKWIKNMKGDFARYMALTVIGFLRPLIGPLLYRGMPWSAAFMMSPKTLPREILTAINFPLRIVDVGAHDMVTPDGEPSGEHLYAPLQQKYPTRVIGFDPTCEPSAEGAEAKVRILPYFIGDGTEKDFHVARYSLTSSQFPPDRHLMERFEGLYQICESVNKERLKSYRLDDIPEVKACDFLKIDTQGSELEILKSAPNLLKTCLAVFVEVEFQPIYQGQPLFADIDSFMRSCGFDFMRFSRDYSPVKFAAPKKIPANSAFLWSDAIYFKRLEEMEKNPVNLLKAALISNDVLRMYDWTYFLLNRYDKLCGSQFAKSYMKNF